MLIVMSYYPPYSRISFYRSGNWTLYIKLTIHFLILGKLKTLGRCRWYLIDVAQLAHSF